MPTLDWLTRDEDVKAAERVPYRLLEADPGLSAHDQSSGNMLIQGDNLEALKSLLPYYAGQVKCIYIDPPYNTRSAFEHYDDNLEHSQWLAMIRPRLELLRELLAEDGSIWVQLDDNEAHYARVLLDELLGRRNFLADISWHKSYAVRSNAEFFSTASEHLLCYAKSRDHAKIGKLPRSAEYENRFSNPDSDPRGPWQSVTMTISLVSGARGRAFARTGTSPNLFTVTSPSGQQYDPPSGRCWSRLPDGFRKLDEDGRIWWGTNGNRAPRLKMFLAEADTGTIATTLWADGEQFGYNEQGVRELRDLGIEFPTPKPEKLIRSVLHIATNPGDLVLDSFLGSGTTAAVAHKMGRRWIGIEMGEHAVTHCVPRLNKVIEGEQGGISQTVGWQGGGGFTFYRLGEAVFDADGRIRAGISFASLAAHVWFSETGIALILPGTGRGTAARSAGVEGHARRGAFLEGSDNWPVPLHHPADGPPPRAGEDLSPFLGTHDGHGYALLYNGVLGDKRPQGGNVLTNATLALIREAAGGFAGPMTVYGEASRLSDARLKAEAITFKQTPYDVKAR